MLFRHSFTALLATALCAVLAGCKNDLDRVAALEVPEDGPDRITKEAEYLWSDSGVVRNRLRAALMEEYLGDAPHTELSGGVEVTFFAPDGSVSGLLTARKGSVQPKEDRMLVEQEVVFRNVRGERLETEQLAWDRASGQVHTDRPVKVTRARDIIYGQGLDASQDMSSYRVHQVTGTVYLGQGDTLAPEPQGN
jgi:LPS export ABC transporter protein LptC